MNHYTPPFEALTLCDICVNACDGCRWSARFEPIPGWKAVRQEGDTGYTVLDCPEFILEERSRCYYKPFLDKAGDPAKRRKKTAPSPYRRITEEERQAFARLYSEGMSDAKISAQLGVPSAAVGRWRRSLGLPPVAGGARPDDTGKNKLKMALYNRGMDDEEIAEVLGSTVRSVQNWRSRHGLYNVNGTRARTEQRRLDMVKQGLSDREIAEKEGVTPKSIANLRRRKGIPSKKERRET